MPEITSKQKQELQELVQLLGSIRGMHTELVTVLIPAGTNKFTSAIKERKWKREKILMVG